MLGVHCPKAHLLAVATLLLASAAQGAEVNHYAFAVETDLQRFYLPENTAAYVLINGSALVRDSALRGDVLDLPSLRRDLEASAGEGKSVLFVVFFANGTYDRGAFKLLEYVLKGVAAEAGLDSARVFESHRNDDVDWREWTERTLFKRAVEGGAETAVGKNIKVFPVRTHLGRLLSSGADCVVHFPDWPEKEARDARLAEMRASVQKLELKRKERITFRVPQRKLMTKSRDAILSGLAEQAKALGFRGNSVSGH